MKTPQFALVLALASTGCSTFSIRADRCPAYPASSAPSVLSGADVKVQYLGTGGYLVRRGDDVVLFGPEYTNPGVAEIMFDHRIQTDRARVDRLLPKDAGQAEAIVIGHSHYDHLLDTPYIAATHATKAKVFGSRTMAALIASAVDPARLVDVSAAAVAGQPVRINDRMRLWPIRSRHSDQFRMKIPFSGINQPFHMWRGEVADAQSALPDTTSGWVEGEVYAYLLDFMDMTGTKVEFRVYYQDSGTDAPVGFPWGGSAPPDGKGVDVALICVGGDTEYLKQHPEGIIKATRPRFLLLGHWENFFMPQDNICRVNRVEGIPLQDTDAFIDRASAALSSARLPGKPILPCPTASVFHFPVDPANDAAVHKALKKGRVSYDCARIP